MKSSSKILILAIFLVFICCVSAASAAENDNVTESSDELAVEDIAVDDVIDEQDTLASEEVDVDEKLMEGESNEEYSDEGYVIYVGHHNQTETGDGSYDNPFATLDLACANVSGESKLTLNVLNGTYYLDSELKFNVSNLMIQGIGDVVIKCHNTRSLKAFELVSPSSNFTMKNIIFDASDYTLGIKSLTNPARATAFFPFYGNANEGTFDNCSFRGFKSSAITGWASYKSIFSNCIFDGFTSTSIHVFYDSQMNDKNASTIFKNCIFLNINTLVGYYNPDFANCSFIDCWFGQNDLPGFLYPPAYDSEGYKIPNYIFPISRYANFTVTQNYLGNNQYEIIGKLTWNGTEDQDGMENFQPMTVNLISATGDINQTTNLVNGNFRAVYNSAATNHKITVTLDNEEIDLEFNTVNITANPVSIYYGEDQNITVTFSQEINSTVSITVNNKTYNVKVNESNSLTYTIEDILKEGNYTVDILLNDETAKLYGATSTNFTVSKVTNYAFDPVIPSEAKVGDDVIITVELPSDANGTVTVYVNNKPFPKEASTNTEITVNGLVAGDNNITVEYSGNDKYAKKTTEPTVITAEKVSVYDFDVVLPTGVKVGDSSNITIELPSDVNGTATVYIGTQDGIIVPVNSASTVVSVSGLGAGNNTIKVVFSDGKYAEKTVTKNLTVEKVPVEIKNNTIVVNTPTGSTTPTVSFNLPNATGNLTVTVKGKTYTKELVNGTATVAITDLPAGTYDATVTYSGDDKFDSITTTTKITVNEAKKQDQKTDSKTKKVTKVATKIVAKNKKFKAKTKVKKYTITLKTKAGKAVKKVQVTIKIGKKTYKAKTNNKGKATFKIKKLTKKAKYKATIKFKGNSAYQASSKKVKITIK